MRHPYQALPESAFWRVSVAEAGPHRLAGLWNPKFPVRQDDVVVTAGSCFAQHIGRSLTENEYAWTDFEPAPPFFPQNEASRFGYGIFSFRTGNIYTASMMLQWLHLAFGLRPDPMEYWIEGDRILDPIRPAIEPDGFADREEFFQARSATYRALRAAIEGCDVFIFTLGLTEYWFNAKTGLEYALCPGTAAGRFDGDLHHFGNANARKVARDLHAVAQLLRRYNPEIRLLLTVSPVPLTATASGQHVLTATSYSKSVLRAAAGMIAEDHDWIDYFPSFEIISHPVFRGMFFSPNMRSVEPEGVRTVMSHFFADQERIFGRPKAPRRNDAEQMPRSGEGDVQCDEVMLDAFAR